MKLAFRSRFFICIRVMVLASVCLKTGAIVESALSQVPVRAESARVDAQSHHSGPLYVRIGNEEKRISDAAVDAWLIENGQYVAYSSTDGAGGYENEGQSLRIYETATDSTRKVLSEYYAIDRVTGVRTASGKLALIVEMRDGGLGASHLAVVDLLRGEVFSKSKVKLLERRSDTLLVGYFRDQDWKSLSKGANIHPYKTEQLNLDTLLRGSVITNRRRPR
jgi:hypothetical protein